MFTYLRQVGQLNDYHMPAEKDAEQDSRWIHRSTYPTHRYDEKKDENSNVGQLFRGMRHLIDLRKKTEELCEFTPFLEYSRDSH